MGENIKIDVTKQPLEIGPTLCFETEPAEFSTITDLVLYIEQVVVAVLDELGIEDLTTDEQLALQLIVREQTAGGRQFISTSFVFTPLRFFETVQQILRSLDVYEQEGVWLGDGINSADVQDPEAFDLGMDEPVIVLVRCAFMDRVSVDDI